MKRDPRALVFRFDGGTSAFVTITDDSTFTIGGQTFALSGVESLALEDADIAAIEADVFTAPIDLGTPVAEWGKGRVRR